MTAPRLRCLVPFCAHTRGQRKGEGPIEPGEEWICGQHWRQTDRTGRHRLGVLRRKARETADGSREQFMLWRQWDALKKQAIERAAGI